MDPPTALSGACNPSPDAYRLSPRIALRGRPDSFTWPITKPATLRVRKHRMDRKETGDASAHTPLLVRWGMFT